MKEFGKRFFGVFLTLAMDTGHGGGLDAYKCADG